MSTEKSQAEKEINESIAQDVARPIGSLASEAVQLGTAKQAAMLSGLSLTKAQAAVPSLAGAWGGGALAHKLASKGTDLLSRGLNRHRIGRKITGSTGYKVGTTITAGLAGVAGGVGGAIVGTKAPPVGYALYGANKAIDIGSAAYQIRQKLKQKKAIRKYYRKYKEPESVLGVHRGGPPLLTHRM